MFLRKKILKRGASKAILTRFRLNINIAGITIGCITGCLITVLCFYLFNITFTSYKKYLPAEQQDIKVADNQNNIQTMPKLKFYYDLPKNHLEDSTVAHTSSSTIKYKITDNTTELNKNPENKKNANTKPITKQIVYYLQIGIFKNLKQAQSIASKIECFGFVSVIEKIKIYTKKDWFRVEIGPFFNLDEIDKAQNKISNQDLSNTLFQYRKKIMY